MGHPIHVLYYYLQYVSVFSRHIIFTAGSLSSRSWIIHRLGLSTGIAFVHIKGNILAPQEMTVTLDKLSVTRDDGTASMTIASMLLHGVYWIYGLQYPRLQKAYFSFFEQFIWRLQPLMRTKGQSDIVATRVHTAIRPAN